MCFLPVGAKVGAGVREGARGTETGTQKEESRGRQWEEPNLLMVFKTCCLPFKNQIAPPPTPCPQLPCWCCEIIEKCCKDILAVWASNWLQVSTPLHLEGYFRLMLMMLSIWAWNKEDKKASCCLVSKSCSAFCDPIDCNTPGFPVLHCLLLCSNSFPLSWWCHPTISSSVTHFSSCPQSFPASGCFPVSWLFISGGQSTAASASVLPVNIQDWFPLGLTGLISLLSKGLSGVFSSTIWKHQFFSTGKFCKEVRVEGTWI